MQAWTDTVLSLASGASTSLGHNVVPSSTGSYSEQLSISIGGKTLVLASQSISVTPPPVAISVSPVAGAHARVLVYYSCQPDWYQGLFGWILGQHSAACFNDRQATLTTYLNNLGVPYTLVSNNATFTQAYRSGLYNNYWLLGAVEPIADDLSDELEEAVNRGDSLVIDSGAQSWNNYPLYQIAGVQYEGQLVFGSSKLSFNAPVYANLSGISSLSTDTAPLYFKVLSGSTAAWWTASQCGQIQQGCQSGQTLDIGFYQQQASASQYPAIVAGQYGQGKTLAIAFDLVGSLQGNSNNPLTQASQLNANWSKLLADSISYTTPAPLTRALIPGELYSVSYPVQNHGQAVNLNLDLSQPSGGDYLSANLIGSAASNGSEQFQAALSVSQLLNLITDQTAPASPGSYNLDLGAASNATPPTNLGSYTYALTVGASQSSRQSQVASDLAAITETSSNAENLTLARSYFAQAQSELNHSDLNDAIDNLADAGNSLALISGAPAAQARSDLDLLLKLLEEQWVAPSQSQSAQQCGLQNGWGQSGQWNNPWGQGN